jgi:hypothetical protein
MPGGLQVKDQSLAIRVQQLRDEAISNGEQITDLKLATAAILERNLSAKQMAEFAAKLALSAVRTPVPPPVPEPKQLSLFVLAEPIRLRDGENGDKWIPPHLATIDEHDQSNDQALQYLETQTKRRKRIKKDIGKARELADGDGKALYNNTVRSLTTDDAS